MHDSVYNQWRQDLIIRPIQSADGSIVYVVRDPISRQSFEFDEHEYFLCQAFNGTRQLSHIKAMFQKRFGFSVSENNLERFARELVGYGLLIDQQSQPTETAKAADKTVSNIASAKSEKSNFKYGITIWSASHPEKFLISLGTLLRPMRFVVWSIVPLLILGCGILIQDGQLFWEDVTNDLQFVPKLVLSLPTLTLNNLMSRGLQTVVATYLGAKTRYLKLFLLLGVIPRLLIDRNVIWTLPRQGKLWSFATPILVRLSILAIGVFIWHQNRALATNLATWAQALILVNCIGVLIEINPFWMNRISSGLAWLLTYFSIDPKIFKQSQQLWQFVLRGQSFPHLLKTRNILFLLSYGAVTVLLSLFIILGLLMLVGIVLENKLQGTGVVIFLIFIIIFVQLIMFRSNSKRDRQSQEHSPTTMAETATTQKIPSDSPDSRSSQRIFQFLKRHRRSLLLVMGGIIVMLFPYPYSVGGKIQLLPRRNQDIQTDLPGKVVEVPFEGGNRQWIEAGTVIGVLQSVDLEKDLSIAQEQLEAQEALLKEREANLAQLLATPRSEEVQALEAALNGAKGQLEAAKRRQQIEQEQLQVALQQLAIAREEAEAVPLRLETIKTEARFRQQEEKRLEELYEGGAIALQRYENVQRLAAIAQDKIREVEKEINIAQEKLEERRQAVQVQREEVEEQKQNVQSSLRLVEQRQADLNLLLKGPHPDQIDAARQKVKQAEATVKSLQQEVTFFSDEIERQKLRMPFDGFLTTQNLDEKIGRYLKQGDTFATAQNDHVLIGIVEIPEVQIDQLSETGTVEIRLLAYPNRKFKGQVKAIEPTAKTDQMFGQTAINDDGETTQYIPERGGQVVSVLVEVDDQQELLMPGMSGYAKIRGNTMPVILAFSRPLMRFFQLEVWSWLP